jgi:hypothetical protein
MELSNYNPKDEISVRNACETAFQSGGPRVYRMETARGRLVPSAHGVKRTVELADDGDVVWSRQKITSKTVGTFYGWRATHKVVAK